LNAASTAVDYELLEARAAQHLLNRRRARESPIDYAGYIDVPGRQVAVTPDVQLFDPLGPHHLREHHKLVLGCLWRTSQREFGRCIIMQPPGTAKTTYGTVTFPAWYLSTHPQHRLICASYGADLAWSMGFKTRSLIRQPRHKQIFGVELDKGSHAADHFLLSNQAEYHATGYNGDLPGRRAEGAICDDIIKGFEEANSLGTRDAVWNAYQSNIMPRLLTGAWLAMIATHWDEDDPFGRILPDTWAGDSGMFVGKDGLDWEVLCLQAQCETTTDPLGRKIGQYMQISDNFENDVKHFEIHKRDKRKWNGLYQQRPRPVEGAFFHENDLLDEVGKDENGEAMFRPFDYPQRVDCVFAVIDSAVKTGLAHDGLAVMFFALSKINTVNRPLMWLDWDLTQIQGAFLNEWIPSVFTRLEELAQICSARMGVAGAWVEDKVSGTILLQQAERHPEWPLNPIESKLTMMGKKERAVNVSGYVAAREVGVTAAAYDKVVEFKNSTRNHALSQVLRFSPDSKDKDPDDCLDTFTYGIALSLGNPEGF
jgi:hypothetical protein